MPEVSVIIPNYNHAAFLDKRITSVLNQTYKNFELIVLDDCSTDKSREVIESYKNRPEITHIEYNKINSGSTFKQWNKGIALASSKYIWIAESDDYAEPGFLEEMMQAFEQEEQVVLAHCQLICLRDNIIEWRSSTDQLSKFSDGKEFICEKLLGYNGIENASGVVFRKDAFLNAGQEYLNMRFCGDWYVWSQICRQGKVFTSGKYLNYFIKHGNDVSSNAMLEGLDFTEGNAIMLENIRKQTPSKSDIQKALEFRIQRLESLKYHFIDPAMYSTIQKILFQYYADYNIVKPKSPQTIKQTAIKVVRRFLDLNIHAL